MKQQIREAVAEATRRGKLRPNSVDSITGENSGDNLGPGTPIIHFEQWEEDAHRGEADPEGRRLREHQRAVRAARPSSITSAAPTARSTACASASSTRSGRRRARAAARAPSASASAAIAPRATCTRRSSCSARSTTRNADPRLAALEDVDHGRGEPADGRADGLQRQDLADRLQDRRAQPAARELLRVGRLRLLGVPPPRRASRRRDRRDHELAVSRGPRRRSRCCRPRRWPPASRAPAARFRCRRRSPTSRSARSRSATSCSISGRVYTGRDAVHAHLMKHEPPVDLRGGVLYHCGPVVVKEGRRLADHRRRADHQHPRGAVPGRHHRALRRARRDRQGRHGREDAGRPAGVRRRLPERRSAARRSSTPAASSASTASR